MPERDEPYAVDHKEEDAINPLHINQECFDECIADNKRRAEIAVYMALNACGVPEEEAVKHARIAVDSVF